MPRPMNLEREGKIRAFRATGMGVRAIAREIRCSPATVSRILRGGVSHGTLVELTAKVSHIEETLERVGQQLVALYSEGVLSPMDRRSLADLFRRHPEGKS